MAQYTVTLTSGTLNLRATPSTSGTVLASIPNHAVVTGILIIPYASENVTADGKNWKSIEYNGQRGWVASEYLTSGNVSTVPAVPSVPAYANGVLLPATTTIDNNPQNSNGMFSLTDDMKKKLKIGAIVIGGLGLAYGIYKFTSKKQQPLPTAATPTALSGVSRRRKKRKTGKKSKKTTSKSKRKSFKLD
jgi:uncharacterized protein YgiM (DUF1202 family)